MIISRLSLKNWKNFSDVSIDLNERNFIIGPNASGKSNLLDSIRFLRDVVKQGGGLQYAVDQRGGIKKIRYISARKRTDIKIEIELKNEPKTENPDWIYTLKIKHTGGGIQKSKAQVIEEKVHKLGSNKLILDRSNNSAEEDQESLNYTILEQPAANRSFRDIYNFLRDVEYLHVVPQLVRESDSFKLTEGKEDFYGRNIFERMAKMNKKTRDSYLTKINKVLKIAVPQLDELTFDTDNRGTPHLEAKYIHWRPQGAKQQEQQFSDGTLRLIGLMWALLDGNETILLEEPELNLHTEIVKKLPEFIYKMQSRQKERKRKNQNRQVLISTHSYDLLDNESIGPNEIVILKPSNEGTEVKKANDIKEIIDMVEADFSPAESSLGYIKPEKIEELNQLKIPFE
ncbi:MAG: AAA family ATPase [Flavobacteriales bacterium]